jgi:uncharacterized membrane protein YfcA
MIEVLFFLLVVLAAVASFVAVVLISHPSKCALAILVGLIFLAIAIKMVEKNPSLWWPNRAAHEHRSRN